ncbi:MAG: hypothetical protein BWX69_03288 [Planctomycetes bacterium ADurb.Bin069]|nr:MAG: hypothetical protein BWX69_03288 [Planctomycetes bacterium ADurb.Bin069]
MRRSPRPASEAKDGFALVTTAQHRASCVTVSVSVYSFFFSNVPPVEMTLSASGSHWMWWSALSRQKSPPLSTDDQKSLTFPSASMAVTRGIIPRSWNIAVATRVLPLPTSPDRTSSGFQPVTPNMPANQSRTSMSPRPSAVLTPEKTEQAANGSRSAPSSSSRQGASA